MTPAEMLTLGALIVSVVTAGFVFIPAWRKSRTEARVAEVETDDKIAERRLGELNRLYERVEKLEEAQRTNGQKISAFGRVLVSIADQWPKDAPYPTFDEADIAILEDTIPAQWRRHRPPRARTT